MGRPQTLKDTNTFYWERNKVGHPTKVYKRYFKGNQQQYDAMSPAMKQKYLTPTQSENLLKAYQKRHAGRSLHSIIADESLPARSNQTTSWGIDGIINRSDFDPFGDELDTENPSGDWRGLQLRGEKKAKSYKVPISKPKKAKSTPKKKTTSSGAKRGRKKDPEAVQKVLSRYKKANVNIGNTKTVDGVTYKVYAVNTPEEGEKLRNNLRKHSSSVKSHDARKYDPKAKEGSRVVLYK